MPRLKIEDLGTIIKDEFQTEFVNFNGVVYCATCGRNIQKDESTNYHPGADVNLCNECFDEATLYFADPKNKEIKMFGCTIQEMKDDFAVMNTPGDPYGMQMRSIGIMSDIQETIQRGGDPETIRQMLNQAKYWAMEVKTILRGLK